MAELTPLDDELTPLADELTCSICLDILQQPVTTPCGHNFCSRCLDETWTVQSPNFYCPLCRVRFPERPRLKKNTALCSVVVQLQQALSRCNLRPPLSESQDSEPLVLPPGKGGQAKDEAAGIVACDHCLQAPAAKTCFTCMASFCQEHLQPHLDNPIYQGHELQPPVGDLARRKCPEHGRLREFFCSQHGVCICSICLVGHKTCSLVALDEARTELESKMKRKLMTIYHHIYKASSSLKDVKLKQIAAQEMVARKMDLLKREYEEIKVLIESEEKSSLRKLKEEEKRVLDKYDHIHQVLLKKKRDIESLKEEIELLLMKNDKIAFLEKASKLAIKAVCVPKNELNQEMIHNVFQNAFSLQDTLKHTINNLQEKKTEEVTSPDDSGKPSSFFGPTYPNRGYRQTRWMPKGDEPQPKPLRNQQEKSEGSTPTFGSGLSSLANTTASAPPTTTTTTPSLFSSASASGINFTPSTASMFQSNKPAATTTASTAVTTATSFCSPFSFHFGSASGINFTPSTGSMFQSNKPAATTTATTAVTTATSFCSPFSFHFGSASGINFTPSTGFMFQSNKPAVTTTATTAVTTATSFCSPFSFHFGSASGVNFTPSTGSMFQSNQPAATTTATTAVTTATSFCSTFSCGGSANPKPALPQPAFGRVRPPTSFVTPASTQPTFVSTNSGLSLGPTIAFTFGATMQTTSSGTSSSMFSSITPAPFTFGSSLAADSSGGLAASTAVPRTSSSTAAFSFGASQSGTASATTSSGGALNQNSLGAPSQSTAFIFSVASTTKKTPVFGGTSMPTFAQKAPAPGAGSVGNCLSFGTPTTSFVGAGLSFNPLTPSFSFEAGSKNSRPRQRLKVQRQHSQKK
ncbi:putative nuclear envelope pore membrane protein POM 121B [Trichosurus vulpecula]|uniref:putative nuclear envelope pore membrane protein POM 121B n=1 Tax=Trichosurus vulpecula TaxID=9337 RepID=UPI00186B0DB7|nr:putative nuclear envelope pore membrane protein POM 121B [Trichosurus vulpecula]